MKMDFNLAPSIVAMRSQPRGQYLVVLLGRKEISMDKRFTIAITPRVRYLGIAAASSFKPLFLDREASVIGWIFRQKGRLEMISECDNEVYRTRVQPPHRALPQGWPCPPSVFPNFSPEECCHVHLLRSCMSIRPATCTALRKFA